MRATPPLRTGYTTGACAAAAALAAATLLLTGEAPPHITLQAPGGPLTIPIAQAERQGDTARAAVQKDAGDDPDITDGALVWAEVTLLPTPGVVIDGGEGVGRVTLPGLDQPVGAAAINSGPRKMIASALTALFQSCSHAGGAQVLVSIPGGEALAQRTYNPRLGIVGGLSVLGTTGVVEPMSEQALVDTIAVELRVLRAGGAQTALVTPGNYGQQFLSETLCLPARRAVKCSNFIGDAVDLAAEQGFSHLLLVGHLGKLSKVAAGIFNTHSRYADARMETICAHAALCGAPQDLCRRIFACVTTDDAVAQLTESGLRDAVMDSLAQRVGHHLALRAADRLETGAILFSNRHGLLAATKNSGALVRALKEAP